jgi:hypothetical protein
MAERYAKLPTEIIRTATTFDLFICDTAMEYRNAQQARMNDEASGKKIPPKLSIEQMQAAMARVKGKSNES